MGQSARHTGDTSDLVAEHPPQEVHLVDGMVNPPATGYLTGITPPGALIYPAGPVLAGPTQGGPLDHGRRKGPANTALLHPLAVQPPLRPQAEGGVEGGEE